MKERTRGGDKALFKPPNSVGIILVIWFLAMGSLLGIHYSLKKKPSIKKSLLTNIEAKAKSMTEEQKIRMKYFQSGILQLANGEPLIIDSSTEGQELAQWGLAEKKIEFVVDDPLFLERQMMVKEASRRLNNAEKRCLIDRHAIILYRDGDYYLVYDPKIYEEYVMKYDAECKPCEENKKKTKRR